MKKIKQNIPNAITISRIISSILSPILLLTGNIAPALSLYIYGAISDALDGLAARKLNAYTELGRQLDPLSDKIYALSLITSSLVLGNYLMLIPLILEGEISSTTIAAKKNNINLETERVGKYKTWLLSISIILGLLAPIYPAIYFPLIASLVATTHFQIQSIHAYENQYLNKLTNHQTYPDPQIKEENKQEISHPKNQIQNHYNEFMFYKNIPIESKLTKPKTRKKVK